MVAIVPVDSSSPQAPQIPRSSKQYGRARMLRASHGTQTPTTVGGGHQGDAFRPEHRSRPGTPLSLVESLRISAGHAHRRSGDPAFARSSRQPGPKARSGRHRDSAQKRTDPALSVAASPRLRAPGRAHARRRVVHAYRPATGSPPRSSSAACPACSASAASRSPSAASTSPRARAHLPRARQPDPPPRQRPRHPNAARSRSTRRAAYERDQVTWCRCDSAWRHAVSPADQQTAEEPFQPLREAHPGCDPSDDLKLVLAPGPWRLASAYPLPDRDVEERAEDASLAPSTEVAARWNTTAIVAARRCEAPSSTALSRPP